MFGYLMSALKRKTQKQTTEQFTIGQVIDTNDPQQMGRVRAFCPAFGDNKNHKVKNIPWAMYVSPFGGMVNFGKRGVDKSEIEGPTGYGMWNIPKVGAYVLIGCIDGDKSSRFYAGCVYPQYMTHTMPHGRFTWNDQSNGKPDGPLDTNENPIRPLYDKLVKHFTKRGTNHAAGTPSDPKENMEWRTRGVDNQVAAITSLHTNHQQDAPGSFIADHAWGDFNFTAVTEENGDRRIIKGPGYGVSQLDPSSEFSVTNGVNYDSMVYSWTTPGFNSISMDDRHDNSRIRIRTTSGHQIIMDDTNERIYINTAGGESWIEIDQVGNIDIYASRDISTHAGGDINFTSDKTFRVKAKEGIHMVSDDELRIHSKGGNGLHLKSDQELHIESVQDTHFIVGQKLFLSSVGEMHVKTENQMFTTSGAKMNIRSTGSDIVMTANTDIHFNGPLAIEADPAELSFESFFTSRIPEHEPWARVYSDPTNADDETNNTFRPKPANYTDPNVGKVDRDGVDLNRNDLWHR